MTTARDIVTEALRECGGVGLGQTPTAEDANKAFTRLNYMLAQWATKRLMVYQLTRLTFVSTGAQTYTIGPGGNFDTGTEQRPSQLETAFQRQLNVSAPVDFPLTVIRAKEDYDRIALKSLTSFSTSVFLETTFPLGNLYFWPIPQASIYQLFVEIKTRLAQFASLDTVLALPLEYTPALVYNLAERCQSMYTLPADPELTRQAREARQVIRSVNQQLPVLQMPGDLLGQGAKYNIYGDYSY
jgi:hypothetical protein